MPHQMAERMSDKTEDGTPEIYRMSENMSGTVIPSRMPDTCQTIRQIGFWLCQIMSENMANRMPDQMPERLPDKASDRMPGSVGINVR